MKEHANPNGKSKNVSAVVVGVDGSEGAKEALRWALGEARLRKAPVRAVHAWMFGYIGGSVEGYPYWGGALGAYTSLGVDLGDLHEAAEDLLERALADAGEETEGIEIERQVIQGPAAQVLVEAAFPGDLLVVGSRGHGGFAGLMLGSVSQQCVHHAPCPIVVVHPPKPTPTSGELVAAAEPEISRQRVRIGTAGL
jgi:nucleotide-binding universal stress UspA family protein